MDLEQLKNLLHRYNLKPNFTYGQNFLLDDEVLDSMLEAAKISKKDAVLEIGPGVGNLTSRLTESAGFVLSIEKDPKFYPLLKSIKKEQKNFRFEIADALEFDFQKYLSNEGYESYKVVANIPYYISGKILQMFLSAKSKPKSITLLAQKEVALNITAPVGELNILGISVQIFGQARIVQIVPAESFYPAPKVDSALIHIDLYEKQKYKIKDDKNFFRIVKACFSGKRKQIHNTLVNNLHLDKNFVSDLLKETKINPVARPQELSIEQWIALQDKISNYSNS